MKLEKAKYYAVSYIIRAHNLNKIIPHGYGTYGRAYSVPYAVKGRLIKKAIRLIRTYSLNIKYGYTDDGITYFEWYCKSNNTIQKRQFSFHGIYDDRVKKTDIKWIGYRQDPEPINSGEKKDKRFFHGRMYIYKLKRKEKTK